jgi:hypothetical protein
MLKHIGRPAPQVLNTHTRGWFQEETLAAESITFLAYQGRPVSYRVTNTLTGQKQYPKTAATNPHFVKKLANSLNELYNTTDYSAITIE